MTPAPTPSTLAEWLAWQRSAWHWARMHRKQAWILGVLGGLAAAILALLAGRGHEVRYQLRFVAGVYGVGGPAAAALVPAQQPALPLSSQRATFDHAVRNLATEIARGSIALKATGVAEANLLSMGDWAELRLAGSDAGLLARGAPLAAQQARARLVASLRQPVDEASRRIDARLGELAGSADPDSRQARQALILWRERMLLISAGMAGQVQLDAGRATPTPWGAPPLAAALAGALLGLLAAWLLALTATHPASRRRAP